MKNNAAFVLLEIVLAVIITACCVTALVGLFIFGLKKTQEGQAYSAVALISKNMNARLQNDPDWPMPQTQALVYNNAIYKTNFYYNLEGAETSPGDAIFRAEVNFVEPGHAAYSSARLDFIFIDFFEAKNNCFIARSNVQRAHARPRP